MNKEKNPNKKKVLRYYLIIAACILIIAAITVAVVFAVNRGNNAITIDKGDQTTTPDDKPDDNPDDKPDDKPTASAYEFILPVKEVNLTKSYTFCHDKTLDYYHYHTGIDLTANEGTQVFACLDGKVESITSDKLLDGTVITLTHANGIKTRYTFVDANTTLKAGDEIRRGDVMGTVAAANGKEYKEGAHLHFEVFRNGEYADPEEYLDIDNK